MDKNNLLNKYPPNFKQIDFEENHQLINQNANLNINNNFNQQEIHPNNNANQPNYNNNNTYYYNPLNDNQNQQNPYYNQNQQNQNPYYNSFPNNQNQNHEDEFKNNYPVIGVEENQFDSTNRNVQIELPENIKLCMIITSISCFLIFFILLLVK